MSAAHCCCGMITDVLLPPLPAVTQHGYGEDTYLVSTVPPPQVPSCTVSPREGSVLAAFTVSCSPPCSVDSCQSRQLTYCFYLNSSKSWDGWFGCFPMFLTSTFTDATKSKGTACFCSSESLNMSQSGLHRASLQPSLLREHEVSVWCLVGNPIFPISDSLLHCGPDPELFPVYLPLGEEENNFILHVTITISNNFGDTVQTNASVKVHNTSSLKLIFNLWFTFGTSSHFVLTTCLWLCNDHFCI